MLGATPTASASTAITIDVDGYIVTAAYTGTINQESCRLGAFDGNIYDPEDVDTYEEIQAAVHAGALLANPAEVSTMSAGGDFVLSLDFTLVGPGQYVLVAVCQLPIPPYEYATIEVGEFALPGISFGSIGGGFGSLGG